jgi:hypothetical protein
MALSGFICHDNYLAKIKKLSDEEVGRLFRALMIYHATGEEVEIEGREWLAFDFIKEDIDTAEKVHDEKCKRNQKIRLDAIENERQRTLTNVNERNEEVTDDNESQRTLTYKEKEKEKEKNIKDKNKEKEKERENQERFDRFWSAYPRKENKPAARRAFDKLKVDDELLRTMLEAIEKQKGTAQWQEDGGHFIPHPATWLNGNRWEDVVQRGSPGKTVVAQNYSQRDYGDEDEEAFRRMLEMEGV